MAFPDPVTPTTTPESDLILPTLTSSIPPAAYFSTLSGLDLTNDRAVGAFLVNASWWNQDPVPLGAHAGYDYALMPCNDRAPAIPTPSWTALDSMRGFAQSIVNYRSMPIPGASSPGRATLKYGFGLGRLLCRPTPPATSTLSDGQIIEGYRRTDFVVVFNAVDKTVWATTDGGDWDDTLQSPGEWDGGRLPGDWKTQIGTIKIGQAPLTGLTDPFLAGPSLGCYLVSQPARLADVRQFMNPPSKTS